VDTPLFSDPGDSFNGDESAAHGPASRGPAPVAPQKPPVTLNVGGDEPLEIVNFSSKLPEPTSAKARSAFVRAAEAEGLLDEDGRHAVSRALIKPDTAAQLVKNNLLVAETVETASLTLLPGHVWTTELWPLLQPRTEAESLPVARPQISGALNSAGEPLAELVLTFQDLQHLAEYMRQTVVHTGHTGNNYAPSILARKVGRPVLAHVVRLEFADGSQPFTVLAVRDGITRLVSAVAARLGVNPQDEQVAHAMITDLLATVPPRAGKAPDASQDHARGREKVVAGLRTRFTAGTATGAPTEDAVRIGQTFTLPAQIYVEVQATPTVALPKDEVFAEAIRAVVGSIHTEFRGWDPAAQAVDVGERALLRAQHTGHLDAEVVKLATGVLGPEHTSAVFGNTAIPDTALWRAVYLVSVFSQPKAFAGIKEQLRALLGITSIRKKRFISYLGPLVDVPWRTPKNRSLLQARRAWSGGGPVPHDLLGTEWEPVPTEDFLSLVPQAWAGDLNARRTLQVAGGIALIADRLLASNIGSALQSGLVPFRADPNEIVDGLGASEAGLYQLAYAAQAFQADRPAINSFSDRELKDQKHLAAGAYAVPAVNPDDPSTIFLDGTGQPERLRQYEVVRLSNPARATQASTETAEEVGYKLPVSRGAQAQKLRGELDSLLKMAKDRLRELLDMEDSGEDGIGPALGTHDEWMRLSSVAQKVSSMITLHEPDEEVSVPGDITTGDYEDPDENRLFTDDNGEAPYAGDDVDVYVSGVDHSVVTGN
jgi:hypothetical protein